MGLSLDHEALGPAQSGLNGFSFFSAMSEAACCDRATSQQLAKEGMFTKTRFVDTFSRCVVVFSPTQIGHGPLS